MKEFKFLTKEEKFIQIVTGMYGDKDGISYSIIALTNLGRFAIRDSESEKGTWYELLNPTCEEIINKEKVN